MDVPLLSRRSLVFLPVSATLFLVFALLPTPVIEAAVIEGTLKRNANDPNDPQNAKETEMILARATTGKIKIRPEVVESAGKRYIEAADGAPQAWQAALALLDYRSFLNVNDIPAPEPITPADQMWIETHYTIQRVTGFSDYQTYWMGESHPPNVPAMHHLDKPDENAGLNSGPEFLVIRNAHLVLDGMFIRNIIVQGSYILYMSKPLELENVYFVNCTFNVNPDTRGQQFAKAVLSPSAAITIKIS